MVMPATVAATGAQGATTRWRLGAAAPWLWATGSLVWYAASAYLTLPLVTVVPAPFFVQPLIWGAAVLGGVLALARLVFSRWLHVSWLALGLAALGLILAGLLEASLRAWAIDRFAAFDAEYIGPTAGLFALIVGSAAAGFGVLLAPRRASLPPLLFAVAGALLSGVVVAMDGPGLGDGLRADSVVPAVLVAAAGAYALVVAFIGVLVAARRELPDDPAVGDD